jgi:hypothetical protein
MRVKTIRARNNLRWSQRVNFVSTQRECNEAACVASTSCGWLDVVYPSVSGVDPGGPGGGGRAHPILSVGGPCHITGPPNKMC